MFDFTAMITSVHNLKVQWVRKLQAQSKYRLQEESFVIEGVRLAEEALQSNWEARAAFYTEELSPRGLDVVKAYNTRDVPSFHVSPHVMHSFTQTQTPQGLLVVLALKSLPMPDGPDFLLILDGVRDPGNLGTILRSAAAAGVQAVLLPPGSTDPYAPKVVRAAMGAHFRLPLYMTTWQKIGGILKNRAAKTSAPPIPAFTVYLADAQGEIAYTQVDFRAPTTILIGSETAGAGSYAGQLADHRVYIPMMAGVESLNAAIAAAILMFEVVRQRT